MSLTLTGAGRSGGGYVPPDLLTDLVAAYRFDDSLEDSSGNGNDLSGGSPDYAAGVLDQAVNNITGSCDGPELMTGDVATATFTVAAFTYAGGANTASAELVSDSGGAPAGRIARLNDGTASFSVGAGSVVTDLPLSPGWHHLAAVYESGDVTLYVDGVESKTGDLSGSAAGLSFLTGAGSTKVAANSVGRVDMLLVYADRALTADEVSALYNGGAGLDPTA